MKTTYQARGFICHKEQDVYASGCEGKARCTHDNSEEFKAATQAELLQQIADFLGADVADFELNACEENGRVDVQMHESESGARLNATQLEAWRHGQCVAWLANYSFYVERITIESPELAAKK